MLCSKFELIPTSIFRVTAILRKCQNFKIPKAIVHGFFPKNGSEITKKFYYIFLYILM